MTFSNKKHCEYEVAKATNMDEAKPIIAAGFEFVHEIMKHLNGSLHYQKP